MFFLAGPVSRAITPPELRYRAVLVDLQHFVNVVVSDLVMSLAILLHNCYFAYSTGILFCLHGVGVLQER